MTFQKNCIQEVVSVCALALMAFVSHAWSETVTFVPGDAQWKFMDNGSDQGTSWRQLGFQDSTWRIGKAQLGYGDGDEATRISYGSSSSDKHITTYFRKVFSVTNKARYRGLILNVLRDDGIVVYLNGAEIYRNNLPQGPISYLTKARSTIYGSDERVFLPVYPSPSLLQEGQNLLAVEVHQDSETSSDLSFNLNLAASTNPVVTRGPYLQQGTPTSVIIRWRTNVATTSRVKFGKLVTTLGSSFSNSTSTTEHSIKVSGLLANTKYFYSVGTTNTMLAGGNSGYYFYTAPSYGVSAAVRVWALGDSGTANTSARAVRDAYGSFSSSRYTNLVLMLGDNAYERGTDSEYQNAVFNFFGTRLRQTVLWPTLGNHDTAESRTPSLSIAYFNSFTLPKSGEVGGAASGTEKYYSFNYANIHFVCLDSMSSDRSAGGTMLTWLKNDLASNTKQWLIAFWHHPPYSKGSHDSDYESASIAMRRNALPILEKYGVDLVLTGHSHSYERSKFIDSYYGYSWNWSTKYVKRSGSGRTDGGGAYTKGSRASHAGAVYVVAGSSGQKSGGKLNHPAMYISLNSLGSMILDINGKRLDAKFLRETGSVADYFTMLHQ